MEYVIFSKMLSQTENLNDAIKLLTHLYYEDLLELFLDDDYPDREEGLLLICDSISQLRKIEMQLSCISAKVQTREFHDSLPFE